MGNETDQLHVLFFPFMALGHMIPTIDMAKLFSARGVRATIITTPLNAPVVSKTMERGHYLGAQIGLRVIQFPSVQAGLPQGLENLDQDASPEIRLKFFLAMSLFQQPLEQLLQEYRPHGLVADAFFPWALDVASKFGIPRLAFQGTGFFAMCALQSLTAHKPYKGVGSDTEPFLLPDLPDEIKLTRLQISNDLTLGLENDFTRFFKEARESEERSYGTIVNTFYELEPAYAEHWRKVLGRKAWHIGPVSLCNRDAQDKTQRGKAASIDEDECLKWLNSKNPDSVIYVCFGSVSKFPAAQLLEIAMGLEASGQQFIWVVRKNKDEGDEEDWLPQGYEKRMEGKGLIIRGWAPQTLILDHEAVGGFVTHCGWNSTLEGVSAGVPMVTWPVFADQFYNEKLLTDVLKIGIGVGAQRWVPFVGDFVKQDAIEKAVKAVMAGEKAEELRSRAKSLGGMARRAIEKGGSSYTDMDALIEELKLYHAQI